MPVSWNKRQATPTTQPSAAVQELTEVAKNAKKTPYVCSRSFDVIEFITTRKDICDFVLVVNSNLGRISHGFGATAIY